MHSAPAKVILFGEHAVVYGKPAIAVAVERRCFVRFEKSEKFMVNGMPMDEEHHRYIKKALELYWHGGPVNVITLSSIPSSSGMGSSASVTVATVGEILGDNEENVARAAFNVEYKVQGRASPIDTSTVTHGKGIFVWEREWKNLLWTVEKNDKKWYIHDVDVPKDMKLVVGFSGVHSSTTKMVAKVKRFVEKNSFAREIIEEIGIITMEALKALENEDFSKIGELMKKNNSLLTILGVSHPALKDMIEKVEKYCYGVKITGAGGGGSIVALTDEPDEVSNILKNAGYHAYPLKIAERGLTTLF